MVNTKSIIIGGTDVEVHRKKIKNLHIGVYPPNGHVRVAAPEAISMDAIKIAVLTRMSWIRRKQAGFAAQERQGPRRYVSGETHYFLGRPLRLEVIEWDKKSHRIQKQGNDRLCLFAPSESALATRRRWMESWHRTQLRAIATPKVLKWSEILGVSPSFWGIREMKTKWGSCNAELGIIWINVELSQKPVQALDYVILHELAHLISNRHDDRFFSIVDTHMPQWKQIRSDLNALPLSAWEK
jgi:predicted metal-dependent hydrolase